ncbi:MAG: uracil phosphoribosyltransferase [Bacteroidales bacterium]|nr:uracil phosphoribosyltransferase [Bacteroidales bacterium]
MQINILNKQNSVVNNYLAELRSIEVQKDSMRFRRNIERIGSIMAYEVSKQLEYKQNDITTPLGVAHVNQPADNIVVGSIMRAGLPMHNGVLDTFDHAENCFISAYRKYTSKESFEIHLEYVATPNLDGKVLIINDPMLATGKSLAMTIEALRRYGKPKHTHVMCVIGSQEGVDFLTKSLEGFDATLWIAAVDEKLDAHKYIVPGLGDAGDLAFGEKM